MSKFAELAKEFGAKEFRAYRQYTGIATNFQNLLPTSHDGVCSGLTLIWLAAQKNNLTNDLFVKNENKYQLGLLKFAENAQEKGAKNPNFDGISNVAKSFGLKLAGNAHVNYGRIFVDNDNVLKFLQLAASPLVYLCIKKHALGVHFKTLPAKQGGGIVSFFDSNYGTAVFPELWNFTTFFYECLKTPELEYKCQFIQCYE